MKLLVFISLFGGLLLASCGGSSSQKNASTQEVNPADTIYLGDLREKFEGDSIFFKVVAPDLMLMDYQYFWAATESEAVEKGLTKEYYKRVKKEISETNEAIKKGVKTSVQTLAGDNEITLSIIIKAAKQDDIFAIDLLQKAGEKIGEGISTLIHLFNPQVLVIGGEIADSGDLIIAPIQQILNKYTLTRLKNQCEIKLSDLNSHSTIMGTLMVVMKNLYYDSESNFSLY